MSLPELFKMSTSAITAHKLRSFLTLVGIIAGVASIIGVMTGISVIQNTIEGELSVLGSTTFQVQKWAAGGPIRRAVVIVVFAVLLFWNLAVLRTLATDFASFHVTPAW